MKTKSISIVGLGYIGLPLAVMLASKSFRVFGYDKDKELIENIKKQRIKIKEKDFLKKFKSRTVQKNFSVSKFLVKSDVYIIAVPTPFNKKNLKPEMSAINESISKISRILEPNNLIIIESTCPIGTTKSIEKKIYKRRRDLRKNSIQISYCPERILPGNTLKELINNDRVIGGINTKSSIVAKRIYKLFVKGRLNLTDSKTAEMCKLVENTYRDINIAYANELSMISSKLNINVWKLVKLANLHPRVNILRPGPGVGGHCIAVDPWFLVSQNKKLTQLIYSARKVNDNKVKWVKKEIQKKINEIKLNNKKNINISFFGATYKSNSEDLRESPSLRIIKSFLNKPKINVSVVEPNVEKKNLYDLNLCNIKTALRKSQLIIFLVNHNQFTNIILRKNINYLDFSGLFE